MLHAEQGSIKKASTINYKNITTPPGGVLIWLVIYLELITFSIALIAFVIASKENQLMFHESGMQLQVGLGTVNTLFLLLSGFSVATSLSYFKIKKNNDSSRFLLVAILFGFLFIVLKTIEYIHKLDTGYGIGYNTFFSYYWLLTLFHVIHVLVGLVILISIYFNMQYGKIKTKLEDFEAGTAFWHMCDLIWLLLFPVLYLIW